jgi:3-carboxy-cis,cis-muconate cycloisomerase
MGAALHCPPRPAGCWGLRRREPQLPGMTFSALDSGLLGPLFRTEAMRACFSDETVLHAMVQAEVALAQAQAKCGLVPAGLADAIVAAADGLRARTLGEATALAGVPTIPFVATVRARLAPDLAGYFHRGATTQDIVDTALVLRVRTALDLIAADLDGIVAGLIDMAQLHRATPCVGRTYGQHAAPITFGFKIAVWLTGVCEVRDALPALRRRVLVASLGGPVGTLASLGASGPAVVDAFAASLDLGTTPLAWHTSRYRLAELGYWLLGLLGALAKIAGDVVSLSSTEIGEVSEPHVPGRGGSSSMPHKRNPVSATVIIAAHTAAQGLAGAISAIMAAAHERPAGAWHAEWHLFPQLFGLASGALREARVLAGGLDVNAERMGANLEMTRGLLFADAALEALTGTMGRHAAVKQIAAAIEEVHTTGATLQDILARCLGEGFLPVVIFDHQQSTFAAAIWVDRAIHTAKRRVP